MKKEINDWERLTEEQKQGVFDAIEEIESGKRIPNEKVMTRIRRKYSSGASDGLRQKSAPIRFIRVIRVPLKTLCAFQGYRCRKNYL